MMMAHVRHVALVATVLMVQAIAVNAGYRIMPRDDMHPRHLQAPAASPHAISFDGDLDKIISLALERAGVLVPDEDSLLSPTESPAPTITPVPTVSPVLSPNVCEGADLSRLEVFKWKYTIETVALADVNTVIGGVEEMLQERLVPLLLSCRAKNAINASIVAIDCTLPLDTISIEAVCAPELNSNNNCTAVDGSMRVFLSDPEDASEALSLTAKMVKKVIEDPEFIDEVGKGLMKINLLGEDDSLADSVSPETENAVADPGFSTFSFVIVAVGGAAVIAFVGSVYYWRRGGERDSDAIGAAGSSLYTDTFTSGGHTESPFSEMVPSAYGFNGNMSVLTGPVGMSPVLEDDSSSQSPLEMDSFDIQGSYFDTEQESADTLGARKRAGGALTAGLHIADNIDEGKGTATQIDVTHGPTANEDLLDLQDVDISTDNESKVSQTISQQLFSDYV